jgi:large subunit ribosomal protein L23
MDANAIIIKPLLTEKSTEARDVNKYLFEVHRDANKNEVTRAIEELYKVTVAKCNIVNVKSKPRRLRTKTFGKTRTWKKAIITLISGDRFPFFEGV